MACMATEQTDAKEVFCVQLAMRACMCDCCSEASHQTAYTFRVDAAFWGLDAELLAAAGLTPSECSAFLNAVRRFR